MHRVLRSTSTSTRTRTSTRSRRAAGAALLTAALAGAGTAGCAAEDGVHDDGAAPSLSAPPSPSPLWPGHKPSRDTRPPSPKPYAGLRTEVPDGGLRKMSVRQLILRDPNVPDQVRVGLKRCPGKECGLRAPVYRDLTGDGEDELVVALDQEGPAVTLIEVYRSTGRTVRPVLVTWGSSDLECSTLGQDLVITGSNVVSANGTESRVTTRYRWDGTRMSPVTPQDGSGRRGRTSDNPAAGSPVGEPPGDSPRSPGPPAVERPER